MRKRVEYTAFFTSVFNCKTVLRVPSPLSWETELRNRMIPHYPRDDGQQLATPLRHTKPVGLDGIHLSVLRELADGLIGPLLIIYWQS